MTTITLITGASRGLGRNTALAIARRGGDVILTYRSRAAEAAAVVAEIEALGCKAASFALDTGDVASFAPFADRLRETLGTTWSRPTSRSSAPRISSERPSAYTSAVSTRSPPASRNARS